VGILPGTISVSERPYGKGYVRLQETGQALWPQVGDTSTGSTANTDSSEFAAHEFHYSRYEPAPGETPVFAYQVLRGYGVDGHHDGLIKHNLLANYCHLQNTRKHPWAERFIAFVRAQRALREPTTM